MKIAVIGQSLFGQEVYSQLRKEGYEVVGVFTIPDKDGKADPLGECAARAGKRVERKPTCWSTGPTVGWWVKSQGSHGIALAGGHLHTSHPESTLMPSGCWTALE